MPPADDADRLERAIADIFRLLGARHVASEVAARSGLDLPPLSWGLLEHLAGVDDMRVSDIAACQGVDISTVTPRLQALEQAGLIDRARLESDGRVSLINISERGREAVEAIHRGRRDVIGAAVDPLDDPHLGDVVDVLERMVARLREPAAFGPAIAV